MKTIISLILFLIASNIFSQSTPEKFIQALVNHEGNIKDYVDSTELARSRRLGINYTEVKNKFLIGFDLDNFFKHDHADSNYVINSGDLEDGYSFAELLFLNQQRSPKYYFLNGKFVAPSKYYTRNWQTKESKYFIFKISEPKYFNDYCIKKLDEFVDKIADTLEFSSEEKALLEKEKLYYIFCKDEDEVQAITGYKSKGQAILAFDEVVTTYQTHYHELAHLLINFKLKTLGLYTLPFFMEGFAVAMGGRGGMAPRVVTDVGYYLQKTGFLTYDSILTYDNFTSQDANMTYAVSGLYNTFLINELGAKAYLEMYKKVNGDFDFVKKIKPDDFILPYKKAVEVFLNKYANDTLVFFQETEQKDSCVLFYYNGGICVKGTFYDCYITDLLVLNNKEGLKDEIYESRQFVQLFGGKYNYVNQYLIKANNTEIKIYNLFNDELVFSYDKSFSINPINIYKSGLFYYFVFSKKILDKDFNFNGFMGHGY